MPLSSDRKRIAVSIGDPAGIGCEVALKALAAPEIAGRCAAVLVGDGALIARCNRDFGTNLTLRPVDAAERLTLDGDAIEVLHVPGLDTNDFRFGVVSAVNGRALIAYGEAAIRLAERGIVDAVVAAPQNQSSVKAAGIEFDGYSTFLARVTGTPVDDVFLLVATDRFCIAHVTLHVSLREAIDLVRRGRVLKAIRATDVALRRMGIPRPRLGVAGLNPHAGENGLFGREEIDEIAPAIADARAEGIDVAGPFGADVMLARGGLDGYVVMIHDQGHIPAKLEHGATGFTVGAPVLMTSVAHGSAHDIAGKGVADPSHMINAIRLCIGGAVQDAESA
jgi:4-hydroxythreonine-4-phosphate dehydrogenase